MPGPGPIVSPVVPLSSTPLLTPVLVRCLPLSLAGPFVELLPVAGETAASPAEPAAPLFCAIAGEAFKPKAIITTVVSFIPEVSQI